MADNGDAKKGKDFQETVNDAYVATKGVLEQAAAAGSQLVNQAAAAVGPKVQPALDKTGELLTAGSQKAAEVGAKAVDAVRDLAGGSDEQKSKEALERASGNMDSAAENLEEAQSGVHEAQERLANRPQ